VKIHRILLFCFLFAFTGQLVLSFSNTKKAITAWCDSDDDSDDTENELWDSCYLLTLHDISICLDIPSVFTSWKYVPPLNTEWRCAIDNPPEIS